MKKKQEYIEKMKECIILSCEDEECAHLDADDILCDLLIDLGHKDIVELWTKVLRWYA